MDRFVPQDAAIRILEKRYFQPGENWDSLWERLANVLASVEPEETREQRRKEFHELMSQGVGFPNSPAFASLGTETGGCAAACFHFRPEDNMESIMEVARLSAMVLKFGGGVGFELSKLRPNGAPIRSTHKQAMGPVGVIKFYNAVGDMVTQAGIRKAALMGILRVDHPDVIRFCRCKEEDKVLANFNVSVSITDAFMKKLKKDPTKPHTAHFGGRQYNILPSGDPILRAERGSLEVLSVEEIYGTICKGAALNGDPGVFFVDNVNRNNPLIDGPGDTENPFYEHGANPCSEISLSHGAACILGSIDLAKFVDDGVLDNEGLAEAFKTMTRMLDNMTDITPWPDPMIKEKVQMIRKIGVGVMGFAGMLDKLGIRYGSEECLEMIETVGAIREKACSEESKQLAKERGVYPVAKEGENHRNCSRTTCPPTGTLAILADTSWGIEPHLYWAYQERRNDEEQFKVLPAVRQAIKESHLNRMIEEADGDKKKLNSLIQSNLPEHMALAKDITLDEHMDVLIAWQRHTDNAISKTIVVSPSILTPEKAGEIFYTAWENKVKGLTLYPEGSREGEPMSIGERRKRKERAPLPEDLKSKRRKLEVMLGQKLVKTYCFVGLDPKNERIPVEMFLKHPHVQDPTAIQFIDLTTRLLSLALRYRYCPECGEEAVPLGKVIKQLRETDGQSMFSVPSIFAKVLGEYLDRGEPVGRCPESGCDGELTIIEGCETCLSCGYKTCIG